MSRSTGRPRAQRTKRGAVLVLAGAIGGQLVHLPRPVEDVLAAILQQLT